MTSKPPRTALAYSGCGLLSIYYYGVQMCMQEHANEYFSSFSNFYGTSAGSILSVASACDISPTIGYDFIKSIHNEFYKGKKLGKFGTLHPDFNMPVIVCTLLEKNLPHDAHRRCRNKVGISLTVLPSMTNWIVSDFNTRAELIQAIVCSCYIPLFVGINLPRFRGKICCDGGLSNNLPYSTDPNVITVSPFSGECDICPNGDTETHLLAFVCGQAIQASWKNLQGGLRALLFFPWEEMEELSAKGYCDTHNFLRQEGVIPVTITVSLAVEEATDVPDDDSSLSPSQSLCSSGLEETVIADTDRSGIFIRSKISRSLYLADI